MATNARFGVAQARRDGYCAKQHCRYVQGDVICFNNWAANLEAWCIACATVEVESNRGNFSEDPYSFKAPGDKPRASNGESATPAYDKSDALASIAKSLDSLNENAKLRKRIEELEDFVDLISQKLSMPAPPWMVVDTPPSNNVHPINRGQS